MIVYLNANYTLLHSSRPHLRDMLMQFTLKSQNTPIILTALLAIAIVSYPAAMEWAFTA